MHIRGIGSPNMLSIKLIDSGQKISCLFKNIGRSDLSLRYIHPGEDVHLETESGIKAAYQLSMPFIEIDAFCLPSNKEATFDINIRNEYVFPERGVYTLWVDYDSSRFSKAASNVDIVKAMSNSLQVVIDQATEVSITSLVPQRTRRPWWNFWQK